MLQLMLYICILFYLNPIGIKCRKSVNETTRNATNKEMEANLLLPQATLPCTGLHLIDTRKETAGLA